MKGYYGERGIDICKDAVSLAGVSLQYVLRCLDYNDKRFYAPPEEAYKHLKGAVSGGPSIVFTRYHEVGPQEFVHINMRQPNSASEY